MPILIRGILPAAAVMIAQHFPETAVAIGVTTEFHSPPTADAACPSTAAAVLQGE
jgi:hypothetical protein